VKNPKTVRAVVSGLKWAAEAMERGEIECVFISHEDHYDKDGFGVLNDNGIRTFTIKYKYVIEESDALKELL
jgi:hypothetical protein